MRSPLLLALPLLALAAPSGAWAQDAEAGASVFRQQCGACHRLDGRNGVGPSLSGLFGRPAGSVAGFRYSGPMQRSGITWDEESLGAFLRAPREKVPGTTMPYVGLRDEKRLADLIAFLREKSQAP